VCVQTLATQAQKHWHPSSKMMTTENSRVNAAQTHTKTNI
jgi:hypothetical protein